MDSQTFDATVSGFYRAAAGLESWDAALTSAQSALGARVAFLHTADARDGQILSIHHGGLASNDSVLDYVRDYHRVDPRRDVVLNDLPNAIGRWWHCHEHFDDRFVARQRFYRDFMQAYDARYTSRVILAPGGLTDPVLTAFAFELPVSRGVLSADEQEIARRLGEHMCEALRAHQRVRSLASKALAGHQLLQGFGYPMWLIDEQRLVSFENVAGASERETERRVGRRGRHFALTRGSNDQLLTEKLMVLCRQGHGATAVIDMRATTADSPAWLHLSLLTPEASMGAFGQQPQVLVTLFDPSQMSPLDAFALANMFNLTPSEAKVAVRLADGLTAAQIGQANGIAVTTVRSHVRHVIHKLGAQRVSDVVRILRQGEALWASADSHHVAR